MFTDSLLDSRWDGRSRFGWSAVASFAVQVLAVGTLLLLPLIYTAGLPKVVFFAPLFGVPSPNVPSVVHVRTGSAGPSGGPSVGRATAPQTAPQTFGTATGPSVLPAPDPNGLTWPEGTHQVTGKNGVWGSTGSGWNVAVAPPPAPVHHSVRISRMMEGNLIHRVQPEYPALARLAHIQGTVVLHAVISRQGTIENLQVISGHPLLIPAALDAVRQWRYRPCVLNGDPVEVETQVTVNFVLGG